MAAACWLQRRAKAAGITTHVGNHTFQATGVTAYLKNGGTLERAALPEHRRRFAIVSMSRQQFSEATGAAARRAAPNVQNKKLLP